MNTLEKTTVGEYVAQDFRTAALFSKYKKLTSTNQNGER